MQREPGLFCLPPLEPVQLSLSRVTAKEPCSPRQSVTETCYRCGEPGPDTREHMVSKAFYVQPSPSDMITLPAHLACDQLSVPTT